MARKSRYAGYYNGLMKKGKKQEKSTPASILNKLKAFKGEAFVMQVPVGTSDAPKQ